MESRNGRERGRYLPLFEVFLPHLRRTKGCIINMASEIGFFVEPICAGYCATKGAIIALTKARAIDHGKEGVRVNCICPGYIDTGLGQGYIEAQPDPTAAQVRGENSTPCGGLGNPRRRAAWQSFLTVMTLPS